MDNASLRGLPELYIARHGQTDWNAEGRLQGQVEVPINALGRTQARRNGRCLQDIFGDRAETFRYLASPLGRAMETMQLIREELGLPPEAFATDDRLIEVGFGDWQGWTMAELRQTDPEGIRRRKADKWGFLPPGERGESYAMLAERVRPVFEALDAPTVLVAHGGVTRSFLALYAGVPGDEAVSTDIPQDRVLHVSGGRLEWV
ncbi:histidine phosphatase family protein [Jiella pacifica]|uniref:Histidine phosphatase family protein n=1 Tax=Jiella pacifica TaxID=2696469 RepID=A0A6N9T1P2_9HYPH|nr:histidine phosphatase family protein [Jiella pacifica]NDW05264.1 histidine phosphatase family protein [Jiella pacifica]